MLIQDVLDKETGRPIVRVEYYVEQNPENPTAYTRIRQRIMGLHAEQRFSSIVVDSGSSVELLARKYDEYVTNRGAKDPRQHSAASTNALEELFCMRLPTLMSNVGLIFHTSRDKDEFSGGYVRNLSAPGRLSARHGLARMWPELYLSYTTSVEKGGLIYCLLTRPGKVGGEEWRATTQYETVPSPAFNNFFAVYGANPPTPVHALVYGDPGTGKSHFLASMPKPLLVLFCDGIGKETPYLKQGVPTGIVNYDTEKGGEVIT